MLLGVNFPVIYADVECLEDRTFPTLNVAVICDQRCVKIDG